MGTSDIIYYSETSETSELNVKLLKVVRFAPLSPSPSGSPLPKTPTPKTPKPLKSFPTLPDQKSKSWKMSPSTQQSPQPSPTNPNPNPNPRPDNKETKEYRKTPILAKKSLKKHQHQPTHGHTTTGDTLQCKLTTSGNSNVTKVNLKNSDFDFEYLCDATLSKCKIGETIWGNTLVYIHTDVENKAKNRQDDLETDEDTIQIDMTVENWKMIRFGQLNKVYFEGDAWVKDVQYVDNQNPNHQNHHHGHNKERESASASDTNN